MSNEYQIPLIGKMACWVVGGVGGGLLLGAPTETIIGSVVVVFGFGLLSHFLDRPHVVEEEDDEEIELVPVHRVKTVSVPKLVKGKKHTYKFVPFDPTRHK